MEYQAIEIKNDGAVAWLTLNRPHNLNALSAQMVAESRTSCIGCRRRPRRASS